MTLLSIIVLNIGLFNEFSCCIFHHYRAAIPIIALLQTTLTQTFRKDVFR